MEFSPLLFILLSPLIGIFILLFIPENNKLLIKIIALFSAFLAFLSSIYVFISYDFSQGGIQFKQVIPWLETLKIFLSLGADGISLPLLLLTGIVIFTGVLVSWNVEHRAKEFFIFLLFMSVGVFGVFSSLNLFFFFLFYELAILPMYLLIGIWGSSLKEFTKEYGAFKLTLQLFSGSAFVLLGIFILYSKAGTLDIITLSQMKFSHEFQWILFPIFCVGFGVLAGMWPLHTWSPIGHATAPTAASMLHAGVLMKMGAYGLLRIAVNFSPEGARIWLPVVAILATLNVLYGAFIAMAQDDLKFVVGYSSVSHMGLVLLGISSLNSLGFSGAVFQMFSHGVMTAALFALVGIVYDRCHTKSIAELGGLSVAIPFVTANFVLAAFTSAALPSTSGFIAELMILLGAFQSYPVLCFIAITGSLITAGYLLRLLRRVFFGNPILKYKRITDANFAERLALCFLSFLLLLYGIFPSLLLNSIKLGITPLLLKLGGR
jgi:NADH-quinone oxidoreductase subunit M